MNKKLSTFFYDRIVYIFKGNVLRCFLEKLNQIKASSKKSELILKIYNIVVGIVFENMVNWIGRIIVRIIVLKEQC